MTAKEIKIAIKNGKKVFWKHSGYEVTRDKRGQFFIGATFNNHKIGLTWEDGVTLNGNEQDFFIKKELIDLLKLKNKYFLDNTIGGIAKIKNNGYNTGFVSGRNFKFTTEFFLNKLNSTLFEIIEPFKEKIKIKILDTGEIEEWTLGKVLNEINRNHSDEWTNFDFTDWREGWNEWCEGDYYELVKLD